MRTYIESLQSKGRYIFSKSEALQALGCSSSAFLMAVSRAQKAGLIVQPKQGFFVIVPVEYRSAGCLPASWFIDDLMSYINSNYYVGLLSAASVQGAGHQQPQVFQVVTNRQIKPIALGRVSIEFIFKKSWSDSWVEKIKTNTGRMKVSMPELTAFDVVRYQERSGYIDNVATIIDEISEKLSSERFITLLDSEFCQTASVQRLGYILDRVQRTDLSHVFESFLANRKLTFVPLIPGQNYDVLEKDSKWHIEVNHLIDEDI